MIPSPQQLRRFFRPAYAPIYVPVLLSFFGMLLYLFADRLVFFLHDRWSLSYLLLSPFIHAGFLHFFLNSLALHYIGGLLLLPVIGRRRFVTLFVVSIVAATLANNLLSDIPAVGISGGLMAILACSLYPFGHLPMKLLLIHDIFRLPPFPLRYVALFVVCLDIAGLLFGWNFFAHWAHLAGFATGLIFGFVFFRYRPTFKRRFWR